jgi:O-antigen/teichoic acid export membrane protein
MKQFTTKIVQSFHYVKQKGFFHLLSANTLIQVVAFASQLFVAGILMPDDVGRIKIVQTYLTIFMIFAGMGFNSSTLKLCSENRTEKEQHDLFRSALLFTLISTVLMYGIILILNYFGLFSGDKLIQYLIPIGLFPIISNSLFMVFVSYFQARKQMKLLSGLTVSNKLISIFAIVIITYFFGIHGYYLAYNISFVLMLVVSIRLFGTSKLKNIFNTQNFNHFKLHWNYARPSMLAYFLSELSAFVDILIIGYLSKDMNQIGFYSFALTITVVFRLFPSTVQQITIPYLSELSTNKIEFRKIFLKYNRILYLVIALTLLIALLTFPQALHWIFSGKYDSSMQYFYWLSIAWSLRQSVQLQNGAIFSLGKIQYNVYISLITLIFNIIVISTSVHFFGLLGACYAAIPGGIVNMISSRYFYRKAENEIIEIAP